VKNSARDNVGATASREREDSHMRLSSIRDGLSACYRSEACLDALLVAALVAPATSLPTWLRKLYQATRSHEDWQLDEVVTIVLFLGVAVTSLALTS
jgi:hypothetical protein